jgi:hypothetical protein
MKKNIIMVIVILAILTILVSCNDVSDVKSNVDIKQQKAQEMQQNDVNNQIGLPDIVNWSEKKNMKYIYELRDRTDLICYLYTKSEVTGKYIYEGECMGYGIPYSTQYSNPEKYGQVDGGEYGAINPYTMPQAEPNGMFMPTSSSATWVIRLSDDGKPQVEYYEPTIVVSPTKKDKRLCEDWSLPENY